MNAADLTALAERVEAATGGDRELDRSIQTLIDGYRHADHLSNLFYTSSLDAAITLVPEGWKLAIWQSG